MNSSDGTNVRVLKLGKSSLPWYESNRIELDWIWVLFILIISLFFEGAYDEEEAAAHAYDLAALKYWGQDTVLNFPVININININIRKILITVYRLDSLFLCEYECKIITI